MKKVNDSSKQKMLAGVALIVVVLLVASSIYIYNEYYKEEEEVIEEDPVRIIDDRISPFENQGLIIEVNRIRHRGLYDKLMTRGNSWKKAPSYYWIVELDGLEYVSKDVEHLGKVTETLINTWDTMFQENKIVRDAEEEQESSVVTFTMVERVKSGLFGRRFNDVERDSFTVKFDYRTGRWSGDDNFRDFDGYGHVLGETFEIWFNLYQMDYDADGIPYWTEVNVLGTDPLRNDNDKDPDEDGIPTSWEWRWGYDPFTWDDHEKLDPDIDGLENIEEYELSKWLSDPYSQDVYCEVDYMGRGGLFDPPHIFREEAVQAITEKYAEHNIRLYFDTGWPDTPQGGGGSVRRLFTRFRNDFAVL
jgi:hypothetical protein